MFIPVGRTILKSHSSRGFRYNTRLMVTIGSGGGHGCSSFYDKFPGLTQIKFYQILLIPDFKIFYLLRSTIANTRPSGYTTRNVISVFSHQGTLGGGTSIINHDSRKRTGPRTVPWGTPRLTAKNGAMTLSTHTLR